MHGILIGWDSGTGKRIRLQIFDNAQLSADSLLYDSQSKGEMETVNESRLAQNIFATFNDRIWCLRFTQADGQLSYGRAYSVLSGGAVISLLLFWLINSLLNTRFKAQHLADQLTADIIVSDESYRNQFANNSVAMLLVDPKDGAIIDVNKAALSFYGYTREQLLAMRITDINTLSASEVGQAMASISPKDGKRFEFQHHLSDGSLRDVEVSSSRILRDTGIGIPAEKIDRLFKKFSQADGSMTRQYGGSGLGLSISKQLAELMGGEAGVTSEEGKGSEFWFTARFNKQAVGAYKESIPPADLHGVRVLIVDDSATNREILTTRMVSWGMRPTDVKDGPGAIKALYLALNENDPFCIAVIDMRMPDMDGETLGRVIREDKRLAGTRMILRRLQGAHSTGRRRHHQSTGGAGHPEETGPERGCSIQRCRSSHRSASQVLRSGADGR